MDGGEGRLPTRGLGFRAARRASFPPASRGAVGSVPRKAVMKRVAGNLVQDDANNMIRRAAVYRTRLFIEDDDEIKNRLRVAEISLEFFV
jgi:hypothetical protein